MTAGKLEQGLLRVTLESPLHLASGAADVNVDADVVHDALGLPYFPARRLRGLLYESALEVAEMGEASGNGDKFADRKLVEELFHHDGGAVRLVVNDLFLPCYHGKGEEDASLAEDWRHIFRAYEGAIRPEDVLAAYTGLRMQTALDEDGRADDATLRTIRVLLPGMGRENRLTFEGEIGILGGTVKHWMALQWAVRNLRRAGGHRWRGFGSIQCTLEPPEGAIRKELSQVLDRVKHSLHTKAGQPGADKDAKKAKYQARQQSGRGKQRGNKKKRR